MVAAGQETNFKDTKNKWYRYHGTGTKINPDLLCAVQGIYEMINRVASKKCNSGKKVHVIVFNVMNFK